MQTVERALSVLEHVAQCRQAPTLREVSISLGLNITTVYHLVNTLEHRGYLARDARGTLRIGARAAVLHQALVAGLVPSRDLQPVVEDLSATLDETAYLTSWADDSVVIQAVVEAPQALRVSGLYVGYRGREVSRASGKAVLAYLPAAARSAVVQANLESHDAQERAKLEEALAVELEGVRRNGFAIDEQTYTPGVYCVAAPYFNADGTVSGSVAVSVPAVRYPKRRKLLISAVRAAAEACSERMGHAGPPASSSPGSTAS